MALKLTAHARPAEAPLSRSLERRRPRRPIAGAREPKQSARGPTSRYSCPAPRAFPLWAYLDPNPPAGMSVGLQTRLRWRTPLRPPPSLFDDTYLNLLSTKFDGADWPAGNP